MYIIFPSEARTKINPSKVWSKWDPSSLSNSGRLLSDGLDPHPSPRPKSVHYMRMILSLIKTPSEASRPASKHKDFHLLFLMKWKLDPHIFELDCYPVLIWKILPNCRLISFCKIIRYVKILIFTFRKYLSHSQVACGQSDDWSLVQLTRYSWWKR